MARRQDGRRALVHLPADGYAAGATSAARYRGCAAVADVVSVQRKGKWE